MESEFVLEEHQVTTPYTTVYYIPNFVTEQDEEYLLEQINGAPKPKWQTLSNRRLQNWGGIVGKKSLISADDIPEWLRHYMDKISNVQGIFASENLPNHVLINEYLPGQGIMPHEDGPAFSPTVTTISLGSHTLLEFYKPLQSTDNSESTSSNLDQRYIGSMLLEPRSLIVIRDDMYKCYMHGISQRNTDTVTDKIFNLDQLSDKRIKIGDNLERDTRISLTIRNVAKVAKFGVKDLIGK